MRGVSNPFLALPTNRAAKPGVHRSGYGPSYGFRPMRRAHDAIAEIHHYSSGTCKYYWVLEADIEACFDQLTHCAITERVRSRVADKRVLSLIKAFLKSGVMSGGLVRHADTGTPQGGIITPPTQWITRAMVTLR